jgi:hypothetical protein
VYDCLLPTASGVLAAAEVGAGGSGRNVEEHCLLFKESGCEHPYMSSTGNTHPQMQVRLPRCAYICWRMLCARVLCQFLH